jgi:predicted metal-dependent RNase
MERKLADADEWYGTRGYEKTEVRTGRGARHRAGTASRPRYFGRKSKEPEERGEAKPPWAVKERIKEGVMRITFYGAAREVGRSCILVEAKGTKILIDAGIKLGAVEEHPLIEDSMLRQIDAVIVSHAHLDHCGYLPYIFSNGFNGLVYSLKPTLELINVIVSDYLQISKPKGVKKDAIAKMPKHYKMVEYHEEFRVGDLAIKLVPAGHILGSAMVEVRDGDKRLLYTGDINLKGTKLLDPAYTEYLKADVLITESTYSGKGDVFPSEKAVLGGFIESIKETLSKGGKVIVPSFAVGRAQEVLFILDDYMRSGSLPKAPIFIDGMINKAMRIYRHNVIYCKPELQKRILMSEDDPFKSPNFHAVEGRDERQKAIKSEGAAIIVTTSGMLKGGPVIRYLEKLGDSYMNKLVLVGYQAEGTPGRELLNGAKEITLDGKKVKIGLKVESYHLSGHADRPQLLKLIGRVQGLRQIFIVHGDEEKQKEFAEELKGKYKVTLPVLKEHYEV